MVDWGKQRILLLVLAVSGGCLRVVEGPDQVPVEPLTLRAITGVLADLGSDAPSALALKLRAVNPPS